VLLLLFTGIFLHYALVYFNIQKPGLVSILPILGTLGLILIVLEGSLEIKFERKKLPLIGKAFLAAFFILVLTSVSIAFIFKGLTQHPFYACFINAIPYSIISSAVTIPSVSHFHHVKKEFLFYESAFSDILGIVLFNFAVYNETITGGSFLMLGWDIGIILVVSFIACMLILYLQSRITGHVKFFLILSILILFYAAGKYFHLSSLIIILVFGLFLNNAELIRIGWFRKLLIYEKFQTDLHFFTNLTAESAFLIRTFFFLLFGFTMDLTLLFHFKVVFYGVIILSCIYFFRFLFLKFVVWTEMMPELFITPRGLISILLFLSIPVSQQIPGFDSGLLLMVILATGFLMTVGLMMTKAPREIIRGDIS
jgi:NhaP-type Na+/H+ or K+/H+ antiporter